MTESEKTTAPSSLLEVLRSDLLPHLVGPVRAFPALRTVFPQLFQLRVVIDANVVQASLSGRSYAASNRKRIRVAFCTESPHQEVPDFTAESMPFRVLRGRCRSWAAVGLVQFAYTRERMRPIVRPLSAQ
jgi:hypothetical protein